MALGASGRKSNSTFLDLPILAVLVAWYLNVPIYLGTFYIPFLTPIACAAATISLLLARLAANGDFLRAVDPCLPLWILLLAFMDLSWFVSFGGGGISIIGPRIVYLSLMLVFYLAFASAPALAQRARRAILWGSVATVPVLAYDISHPFTFVPLQSEFAYLGRAAALYINPNQAAAALCCALLITMWDLSGVRRWLYVLWIYVGVLLTGSRGALLLFPVVLFLMVLLRRFRVGDFGRFLGVLAAIGICGVITLPLIADYVGVPADYISSRFEAILDRGGSSDVSGDERGYLAAKGFERFRSSPVVGNGVGSTELWAERSSTHNMFLQFASDFGFLGILLLPILTLVALVNGARFPAPNPLVSVALFYVFWGVFSHNLVTEVHLMLCVALAFSARRENGDPGETPSSYGAPSPVAQGQVRG